METYSQETKDNEIYNSEDNMESNLMNILGLEEQEEEEHKGALENMFDSDDDDMDDELFENKPNMEDFLNNKQDDMNLQFMNLSLNKKIGRMKKKDAAPIEIANQNGNLNEHVELKRFSVDEFVNAGELNEPEIQEGMVTTYDGDNVTNSNVNLVGGSTKPTKTKKKGEKRGPLNKKQLEQVKKLTDDLQRTARPTLEVLSAKQAVDSSNIFGEFINMFDELEDKRKQEYNLHQSKLAEEEDKKKKLQEEKIKSTGSIHEQVKKGISKHCEMLKKLIEEERIVTQKQHVLIHYSGELVETQPNYEQLKAQSIKPLSKSELDSLTRVKENRMEKVSKKPLSQLELNKMLIQKISQRNEQSKQKRLEQEQKAKHVQNEEDEMDEDEQDNLSEINLDKDIEFNNGGQVKDNKIEVNKDIAKESKMKSIIDAFFKPRKLNEDSDDDQFTQLTNIAHDNKENRFDLAPVKQYDFEEMEDNLLMDETNQISNDMNTQLTNIATDNNNNNNSSKNRFNQSSVKQYNFEEMEDNLLHDINDDKSTQLTNVVVDDNNNRNRFNMASIKQYSFEEMEDNLLNDEASLRFNDVDEQPTFPINIKNTLNDIISDDSDDNEVIVYRRKQQHERIVEEDHVDNKLNKLILKSEVIKIKQEMEMQDKEIRKDFVMDEADEEDDFGELITNPSDEEVEDEDIDLEGMISETDELVDTDNALYRQLNLEHLKEDENKGYKLLTRKNNNRNVLDNEDEDNTFERRHRNKNNNFNNGYNDVNDKVVPNPNEHLIAEYKSSGINSIYELKKLIPQMTIPKPKEVSGTIISRENMISSFLEPDADKALFKKLSNNNSKKPLINKLNDPKVIIQNFKVGRTASNRINKFALEEEQLRKKNGKQLKNPFTTLISNQKTSLSYISNPEHRSKIMESYKKTFGKKDLTKDQVVPMSNYNPYANSSFAFKMVPKRNNQTILNSNNKVLKKN